MRIEYHLDKAKRFEKTIGKLDYSDDYETMIEDFLLAAAHYINACFHKVRFIGEDRDIKHTLLFGFLKREKALGSESKKIVELIQGLEQLRPSHVYGRGENGETARKAEEFFNRIKVICLRILKDESKS